MRRGSAGCMPLLVLMLALPCATGRGSAQTLPATAGESLSGQRMVLADAIRGHASIVLASFSRDASSGADQWAKAIHADPALGSVAVYQAVMLGRAPGFVRGMIKSGIRKQTAPSDQGRFVVLTEDEALWRSFFAVASDKEPYVVLIDAAGQLRWRGHGDAAALEPLLKKALL